MKIFGILFEEMNIARRCFDCENPYSKAMWKTKAVAFARGLSKQLHLAEHEIHFNYGGTAVSGEVTIFGKALSGKMFYLYLGADFPGYFRSVTGFKDYTGGPNQTINMDDPTSLCKSIERILI